MQAVMAPVAILYCLPFKVTVCMILVLALLISPNFASNLVRVSRFASLEVLTATVVTTIFASIFIIKLQSALWGGFEDNFESWPWSRGDAVMGERSAKRTRKMEVRAAPCPFTGKQNSSSWITTKVESADECRICIVPHESEREAPRWLCPVNKGITLWTEVGGYDLKSLLHDSVAVLTLTQLHNGNKRVIVIECFQCIVQRRLG